MTGRHLAAPGPSNPVDAVQIVPLLGIGPVGVGDDLAAILLSALDRAATPLRDGDVLVVSSKVVSKSEGRVCPAEQRGSVVAGQSRRLVAARSTPAGTVVVVQSAAGPVMAAAGVDASNTDPGTVLLLPVDADASARRLRAAIASGSGHRPAVLISDSAGRPWREGQTDFALGVAGLVVVDDLRGARDASGQLLQVTVRALADEVAAAADLVKGKLDGVPAALLRGLGAWVRADDGPGARALLRPPDSDWFRLGHVEAVRAALGAGSLAPPPLGRGPRAERIDRALEVAAAGVPRAAAERLTAAGHAGPPDAAILVSGPEPTAVGMHAQRVLAALWCEDLVGTVLPTPGGAWIAVQPGEPVRR